jgi:hypothetical protein
LGDYYSILPSAGAFSTEGYIERTGGERVAPGFAYNSGTNDDFLTVEQLRDLIVQHVDSSHSVLQATS